MSSNQITETFRKQRRDLSSGAMARTGLRMMPTSPSPPLKFRTAGFPQYGFKASLSDRAFQSSPELKSTPDMRSGPHCCSLPFARPRAGTAAWALSPTRPTLRRAAVQAAVAALPQGSLAPERVLLSPSITAYYDPIRQSREHATISRPCRLYAAPSLCGSASATRETFPTFAAQLSRRAVDHTPVGSRGCPVARAPLDARLPRFVPESPPTTTASASYTRRVVRFRCGIVRVMLRPVCLPCPPDWLPRGAVTCAAPRVLRTLSPPLGPASVAERRWESG